MLRNRLSHHRHGDDARATFHLVVPLPHEGTDMRVTDTAGDRQGDTRSGAVSPLEGWRGSRRGDVDSTNGRSTLPIATTPGIRTSIGAIRTTTTRTTTTGLALSADEGLADHADFSFIDLVAAYFDCRRTKRNSSSALLFERDLERNLAALYDELRAGAYRPGRSICFVVTRPKPREVWAADFRDRIIHHLLYRLIGSRFERSFIADSCACIPRRGTLYAAQRLEAKVRSLTQNWSRPAWYLKCDLSNFFVSIDKRVLHELIARRVPEPSWLALAELILFHDPRGDVEIHSPPELMALIPPHKSLFNQPAHLGLPIGNLSSQFFANVLLDLLDQHVKHELRCRHYVRYVDDFVLLHDSPRQLNAWLADIAAFLPLELGLSLNPRKTVLQPIGRGIDFVGHVIKPWRRTIRRRTVNEALRRCAGAQPANLFESANSYFGLLRQATHSHADRARLANTVRRRGHAVSGSLTKAFRSQAKE
jgi:RNA-directed DNA polymerase